MIDIESYVFDKVATPTRAQFTGISVKSEYEPNQSVFPCVTIECKDNRVAKNRISGENIENAVYVMFETDVYTNNGANRKKTAKKIMSYVDEQFAALGFVRTMCNPIPNLADSTIYRLVSRYEGVAERNGSHTETVEGETVIVDDYIIYTS